MFQPNSRYYSLAINDCTRDGRIIRYVSRRIIPRTPVVTLAEHRVVAGDRIDLVTARYLGDAEQFWRVGDANPCERAQDLTTTPGEVVVIPMPSLRP